eukprot:CAMPEP_0204346158 /NCGR_PEP_ID=MMETSP0469-20131031/26960_1 /ASSEMBLY_ACC=CAM_ASM_000384 /TAXON_ID=2969 /ORGANISM="Oxyrrhis marina" /LENGTH=749 /DNA_ID=CAMNT_0051331729 /DNA_START=20 /DNA_END=2269 /DNA_ORIENTATION=-
MRVRRATADCVSIVARVRPFVGAESQESVITCSEDRTRLVVHDVRHRGQDKEYDVDRVYPAGEPAARIFEEQVADYLPTVLNGRPMTVFMHGASGSGKTHTIQGTDEDTGLIPLIVQALFANPEMETQEFCVTVSCYEILNDKVRDLFTAHKRSEKGEMIWLPMRDNSAGEVVIAGLQEITVSSARQLIDLWRSSLRYRSVGRTALNEESSRSHCCLQISVDTVKSQPKATQKRQPMSTRSRAVASRAGRLYLVDLAGCEDNRKTENRGERMQESRAINSSHLALGKVLLSLRRGEKHIPFRESKLTRLLKKALDGKNRAVMVLTLSPAEEKCQATQNTFNSIQLEGRALGAPPVVIRRPSISRSPALPSSTALASTPMTVNPRRQTLVARAGEKRTGRREVRRPSDPPSVNPSIVGRCMLRPLSGLAAVPRDLQHHAGRDPPLPAAPRDTSHTGSTAHARLEGRSDPRLEGRSDPRLEGRSDAPRLSISDARRAQRKLPANLDPELSAALQGEALAPAPAYRFDEPAGRPEPLVRPKSEPPAKQAPRVTVTTAAQPQSEPPGRVNAAAAPPLSEPPGRVLSQPRVAPGHLVAVARPRANEQDPASPASTVPGVQVSAAQPAAPSTSWSPQSLSSDAATIVGESPGPTKAPAAPPSGKRVRSPSPSPDEDPGPALQDEDVPRRLQEYIRRKVEEHFQTFASQLVEQISPKFGAAETAVLAQVMSSPNKRRAVGSPGPRPKRARLAGPKL